MDSTIQILSRRYFEEKTWPCFVAAATAKSHTIRHKSKVAECSHCKKVRYADEFFSIFGARPFMNGGICACCLEWACTNCIQRICESCNIFFPLDFDDGPISNRIWSSDQTFSRLKDFTSYYPTSHRFSMMERMGNKCEKCYWSLIIDEYMVEIKKYANFTTANPNDREKLLAIANHFGSVPITIYDPARDSFDITSEIHLPDKFMEVIKERLALYYKGAGNV